MLKVDWRAPSGTTGISRALGRQQRKQFALEGFDHSAHMAHGAVAEKRHRAVGDAPHGFDLGPPDATMAEAYAVLVQRLGDDDVIDAGFGEKSLAGKMGDAAEAAGFLVDRA